MLGIQMKEVKGSILEKMGLIFNQYNAFNSQVVIRYRGNIDEEIFHKAVNLEQQKQFNLSCIVKEDAVFERKEGLDYEFEIISTEDEELWKAVSDKEFQYHFQIDRTDKALFRIKLIEGKDDNYFLYTMPHFISDGHSMFCMLEDLIHNYNLLLQGRDSEIDIKSDNPYVIELTDILDRNDGDFSVLMFDKAENNLKPEPVKVEERVNKREIVTIPAKKWNKVIKYCKEKGFSVQSYISCIASKDMAEMIWKSCPEASSELVIDNLNALDLRKELKNKPDGGLGFAAMSVTTGQVKVKNETNISEIIPKLGQDLKNYVEKNGAFKTMLYINGVFQKTDDEFMEDMQFKNPFIFTSNLGRLPEWSVKVKPDDDREMKVENVMGAGTMGYLQGNKWGLSLTVICYGDAVSFSVIYIEPYWNQQMAATFLKSFVEKLMEPVMD